MIVTRGSELEFLPMLGRRSADPLRGQPAEGVSARVVWVDHTPERTPHRHPHSPEVIYVVEGTGTTWQDGGRSPVGPGDVIFVPTGVPHATLADRGSRLLLVCFFPHPNLGENTEELTDRPVTTDP